MIETIAYIPCTSCFVNGSSSATHITVTGAGNPNTPHLSRKEMQDLQVGGMIILICLAGLVYSLLIDYYD